MLYLVYGTDAQKSRNKLHQFLSVASKKRPDAEIFKLNSENWSEGKFDELLISRGLFESKYVVVLDRLFDKKDIKEFVLERLKNLKESEQVFFMLEGKIDAPTFKKIEKFAEKIEKCDIPGEPKSQVNIFGITDDLARKDKKRLWVSYLNLILCGVSAEEIHGVLFWQVKNMILASRSKETGLSPFVYQKSLAGSKKFPQGELMGMSSQLVDMTHRVRTGVGDLDIMLEKWILEMK